MHATTRPVARTTWEAAATRAAAAPQHRLPCPGCASSVKGANLTEHVHRVHLSGPQAMAAGHPVHIGQDRRLRRTAGWFVGFWLAAVAGLIAVAPAPVSDAATVLGDEPTAALARRHLEIVARTPAGVVLLGGLAVLLLARLVRRCDRARARVAVTNREVVLQHRYGTGIERVALPARVEAGTLIRRVGGGGGENGDGSPSLDEQVGSYLRVGRGRHAVTVGCPSGTRVRKHWAGWTAGPARRRWDITLAPAEFVAFQYALAAAGALVPRV
ncbi:MAG TPA: hypothetical protein VF228_24220 [Iamia sp.]